MPNPDSGDPRRDEKVEKEEGQSKEIKENLQAENLEVGKLRSNSKGTKILWKEGVGRVTSDMKLEHRKTLFTETKSITFDDSVPFYDWIGFTPSQVDVVDTGIRVLRPGYQEKDIGEEKLKKLKQEFDDRGGKEKVTVKLIKELALKYGFVTGKWIMNVPWSGDNADRIWQDTVSRLLHGKMKNILIIRIDCKDGRSTNIYTPTHTRITFFTEDFTNTQQIREALYEIQEVERRYGSYYKPDIYSHFEIFKENPYGIRPSLMTTYEADIKNKFHMQKKNWRK